MSEILAFMYWILAFPPATDSLKNVKKIIMSENNIIASVNN